MPSPPATAAALSAQLPGRLRLQMRMLANFHSHLTTAAVAEPVAAAAVAPSGPGGVIGGGSPPPAPQLLSISGPTQASTSRHWEPDTAQL